MSTPKTVAIQGYPASFHDIAARQFFKRESELVCCDTFAQTFRAVSKRSADYAVVAIENSLYGSINEVYDLLLKHKFWISGEVYLRIEQCLIGLPGARLEDITEVHSHPVALAQCEAFLDQYLPDAERFESHDTAGSVADVKKWRNPQAAAIAGRAAAELYSMEILAEEIETNKQNYTRFVVLQPEQSVSQAANKTSLMLMTDHKPGALHRALGCFADRGINLTKLQSRPVVGQAWHYMFYVDVATGYQDTSLREALDELKQQQCDVTVLGSYTSGLPAQV